MRDKHTASDIVFELLDRLFNDGEAYRASKALQRQMEDLGSRSAAPETGREAENVSDEELVAR